MTEGASLAKQLRSSIERRRSETLDLLRRLIDLQGGSEDKESVDRVGALLAEVIGRLGFSCQRVAQEQWGDHLVLRNHPGGMATVLAGHMDTTFTDYSELPAFRLEGERAIGPGTADMRGGLVVLVEALAALAERGLLSGIPVTVVLTSDEERGAPSARELFHRLAAEARQALFFECAGPAGEMVIGRRGKLSGRLQVEGCAAHAAQRDQPKASAILELAHQIVALEALDGQRHGCSVNVGLVRGGMASNTVAKRALLEFDVRFLRHQDRLWVESCLAELLESPRVPGCQSRLQWTSERPVWEPGSGAAETALVEALCSAAETCKVSLGTEVRWGTSDANFFAERGVATVDGLGPIGFNDHTEHEHILIESLFERASLVALALLELGPHTKSAPGRTNER